MSTTKEKKGPGRPTLAETVGNRDPEELRQEQEEDKRLTLIDLKYGDELPFDQTRIETEITFFLKRSAESYFEAGKRLIRLKEHVGHGHFLESLGRIGIGEDVAQKTMFTVRKFLESGLQNTDTIGIQSTSKLYEIALLEPVDIKELAAGGEVAGLTRDDIDRMSTHEVRAALRKERTDRAKREVSLEGVISQKNLKLDDLERKMRATPDFTPREVAAAGLNDLKTGFIGQCMEIKRTIDWHLDWTLTRATQVRGAELDQLRQWVDEITNLGTEAVIDAWEKMTSRLDGLVPAEAADVERLG